MSDDEFSVLISDWTDVFSSALSVSSTDEGRKSLGADVDVNSAAAAKVTGLILDYWTSCHCML